MVIGGQFEQKNKGLDKKIESESKEESLYVFSLKNYMETHNATLEEAVKNFLEAIKNSPGGGVEHLDELKKAEAFIKIESK